MKYKILNSSQNEETVTVRVEYTLEDNSTLTLDVPIFMPQTVDDITTGIENRAMSEQAKLDATKVAKELMSQIPTGEVVNM